MFTTDKHLKVEKVGKVWRATYDGKTICSCRTKRATEQNAEFIMRTMPRETWRALVGA
jgi:hypothetical protein